MLSDYFIYCLPILKYTFVYFYTTTYYQPHLDITPPIEKFVSAKQSVLKVGS